MRLIDADKASEKVCNSNDPPMMKLYCDTILASMPTIDAVPVVRCGECKHYKETNSKNGRKVCYKHLLTPHPMLPDEFCSRGERKDGEG